MNDQQQKQLQAGLKQVFNRLLPLIQASVESQQSMLPVDTMLTYIYESSAMEMSPKLSLAEWIKSQLEKDLKDIIRSEVLLQCQQTSLTPEKMKLIAPAILSKILQSQEFNESLTRMDSKLNEAVKQIPLATSSPSISRMSSFNNDYYQDFSRLGDKLNPYSSSATKTEALKALLNCSGDTVVYDEAWHAGIKSGVGAALFDPHYEVAAMSLKVHARLLAGSTSHYVIREIFTCVTASLASFFRDRTRSHLWPTADVLSSRKKIHLVHLNVVRFLTLMARDVPKYWMRFPRQFAEAVANAMVEIMALNVSSKTAAKPVLSPSHLLAFIDPNVNWLRSWLHSHYGRSVFFSAIDVSTIKLLTDQLKTIMNALKTNSPTKRSGMSVATGALLSYHINIVCMFLSSQRGRSLMFQTDDQLEEFVIKLLNHAIHPRQALHNRKLNAILINGLQRLTSNSQLVKKLFARKSVLEQLVLPLTWTTRKLSSTQFFEKGNLMGECVKNACLVLSQLFMDNWASALLFQTKSKGNVTDMVLNLAMTVLEHSDPSRNVKLVDATLRVCQSSGRHLQLGISPLYPKYLECLASFTEEMSAVKTPTNASPSASKNQAFFQLGLSALVENIKTPLGAHFLATSIVYQQPNALNPFIWYTREGSAHFECLAACEGAESWAILGGFVANQGLENPEIRGLVKQALDSDLKDLKNALECLDVFVMIHDEFDLKQVVAEWNRQPISEENSAETKAWILNLFSTPSDRHPVNWVDSLEWANSVDDFKGNFDQFLGKFGNRSLLRNSLKFGPKGRQGFQRKDATEVSETATEIFHNLTQTNTTVKVGQNGRIEWLPAVIAAVFGPDESEAILVQIGQSEAAPLLWLSLTDSDHTMVSVLHQVGFILRQKAFKVEGKDLILCWKWIRQLFLNVLPFGQVCHFIAMAITFGPQFVAYFCVSVFKHFSQTGSTRDFELVNYWSDILDLSTINTV